MQADQPLMYELFKKENIMEAKIQRSRNALGTEHNGHDATIVTFQNGAWYARHAGCYCDASRWRRFGTDKPINNLLDSISRAWNMHRPPTNTQNNQRLN